MSLARSVWAWAVVFAWCLTFLPLVVAGVSIFPRRFVYWFGTASIRLFLRAMGIRVRVVGLANWDPDQSYVIMGNHINILDPFVLGTVFPRPFSAIEKRENFRIPFYGLLMKRWGNIPIDRSNRAQAIKDLEAAIAYFRRDAWILVLPEGTRTRTGRMSPFKKGGFHMALQAGVPVAPYSMIGAWDVMRTGGKGAWRIRPGEITVVCHPPIPTDRYGVARLDDLMADVRRAIATPLGEAEAAPVLEPVGAR